MNVPVYRKKAEAVDRLKKLGIYSPTVSQFEETGIVSVSESPFGIMFWANDRDREIIKRFEETHEAVVYAGIRSRLSAGVVTSWLYVSDYPEEWEAERKCLSGNKAIAYVYNETFPELSECGWIGIERTAAEGLVRTY